MIRVWVWGGAGEILLDLGRIHVEVYGYFLESVGEGALLIFYCNLEIIL